MDSTFDAAANAWDTPYRIERARVIARSIGDAVPEAAFANTLEFGCGTGLITFNLVDKIRNGVLIDASEGMIGVVNRKIQAAGYRNLTGRCQDVLTLPPLGQFSFIYSSMAAHHVDDIDALAQRCYGSLGDGGFVSVVDLCKDDGWFHKNEIGFHGHNGFEIESLARAFSAVGFRTIHSAIIYQGTKRVDDIERSYSLFILTSKKN